MKTQKIMQYSALVLAASAILPMACNKDKETGKKIVENLDDPEIDIDTISITFSHDSTTYKQTNANILGVSINLLYYSFPGFIRYVDIDLDDHAYMQQYITRSVNSTNYNFLPILNFGTTIDTSKAAWLSPSGYSNDDAFVFVNDQNPAPGASSGINGQGDKYIAFRKGSESSYRYGWMKLNMSNDGKILIIKEVALANKANKIIKVGDE